jgi:Fe-S-cluster containining protein
MCGWQRKLPNTISKMPRYCLNIHADYACAHSGACCTAGWPIPVEAPLIEAVRRGQVPVTRQAFDAARAPDGSLVSVLATAADGACVFFERENGRLCAVHRTRGPALLPSACRNFPRVALRDPRGIFVTLSHYCPTAARLLLQDRELAVVEAPASMTLDDTVEGLDATGVLPPLLRPGMLMTLDAYSTWEREAVAALNDRRLSARAAVAAIEAATTVAIGWLPEDGDMSKKIEGAFADARQEMALSQGASRMEHAIKSFLAAHAFANWAAYQQGGLGASVTAIQSALTLLEGQLAAAGCGPGASDHDAFITAVRQTDFLTRHAHTDAGSGPLSPLRRD